MYFLNNGFTDTCLNIEILNVRMTKFPAKSQIAVGSTVSIETRENQGSEILTDGIVDEILTSAESHPHGIKVRLINNQVGRVKKILTRHVEVNLQDSIVVSDNVDFQITLPRNTSSTPALRFVDLDKIQIPKTEDKQNEFKEFYQYDKSIEPFLHNSNGESKTVNGIRQSVQKRLAIAICSFGNDREGGFVYIGINSKGTILGLEKDRKLGGFSDYDDFFANHIRDSLYKFIKNRVFFISKLQMKFRRIQEKTICIIQVLPSGKPLYVNADSEMKFFVRGIAPRAEKLDAEEQYQYIKDRFPNY